MKRLVRAERGGNEHLAFSSRHETPQKLRNFAVVLTFQPFEFVCDVPFPAKLTCPSPIGQLAGRVEHAIV